MKLALTGADSPAEVGGFELMEYPCRGPARLRQALTTFSRHDDDDDDGDTQQDRTRPNESRTGELVRSQQRYTAVTVISGRLDGIHTSSVASSGCSCCRATKRIEIRTSVGVNHDRPPHLGRPRAPEPRSRPRTEDCNILWRQYWD